MVSFAELKAKAEKAKDVSVAKVTNTRDRMLSQPSSKINWDPNWKRGPVGSGPSGSVSTSTSPHASTSGPPSPPPPLRARPDVAAAAGGGAAVASPAPPRVSRPTDVDGVPAPPTYTPRPPPTRVASGYPPRHRETSSAAVDRIDWANLSVEDKQVLFGWLDEFFSQYLGISVGPTRQGVAASGPPAPTFAVARAPATVTRPPPTVNLATRPQM